MSREVREQDEEARSHTHVASETIQEDDRSETPRPHLLNYTRSARERRRVKQIVALFGRNKQAHRMYGTHGRYGLRPMPPSASHPTAYSVLAPVTAVT